MGLAFGDGGFYLTRIDNGNDSASLYITAVDDTAANADVVLAPKGTGAVKVTGNFIISDQTFILEDAQGPKVRFEVGNVGTGTNTRIMTMPAITSGNGTTIVGDDTTQTLRNKTILIDEDNFVITDGDEEAVFQINWATTQDARRQYFLPDAGTVTTSGEPTATSSTLLDTKADSGSLGKSFVNMKLVANADDGTNWAQFNTDALTANRTLTIPNQSLTLVGESATQTLSNKSIEALILVDGTDATKKITFNVSNVNTQTNESVYFPDTPTLNGSGQRNTIVLERATQTLREKTLIDPNFSADGANLIEITCDNITATRTIRFPDADATLLSTNNVTLDDVNFGAGIGANNLTGQTRLQQFFYAGF